MSNKGKAFGYVCPVCQEALFDKEDVVHTEDGLAHNKCLSPNKVERVGRQVIENKLLTALQEDANVVAILATEQDLKDMIAALYGYEIGTMKGNVLTWEECVKRRKDLAASLSQLSEAAFGGRAKR